MWFSSLRVLRLDFRSDVEVKRRLLEFQGLVFLGVSWVSQEDALLPSAGSLSEQICEKEVHLIVLHEH